LLTFIYFYSIYLFFNKLTFYNNVFTIFYCYTFDTIDRNKLIQHTRDLFGEDEWRMILKLLSHTNLEVKLERTKSRPFNSNIGTPQGETLSPILFIVYLEFAMRELRSRLVRPTENENIPQEIGYADDQDLISRSNEFLNKTEEEAMNTLAHRLQVNKAKTERTLITRATDKKSESWRKTKKLGTLLGDSEEVTVEEHVCLCWYFFVHAKCMAEKTPSCVIHFFADGLSTCTFV
jgi:hypothetical protein